MAAVQKNYLNTLRLRQNGHHFAGDIFKCSVVSDSCHILYQVSLNYVSKGPIDNKLALV